MEVDVQDREQVDSGENVEAREREEEVKTRIQGTGLVDIYELADALRVMVNQSVTSSS